MFDRKVHSYMAEMKQFQGKVLLFAPALGQAAATEFEEVFVMKIRIVHPNIV